MTGCSPLCEIPCMYCDGRIDLCDAFREDDEVKVPKWEHVCAGWINGEFVYLTQAEYDSLKQIDRV